MKIEEKNKIYREWCQNNRCDNKRCICSIFGICEDIRGIEGCKNWKEVEVENEKIT